MFKWLSKLNKKKKKKINFDTMLLAVSLAPVFSSLCLSMFIWNLIHTLRLSTQSFGRIVQYTHFRLFCMLFVFNGVFVWFVVMIAAVFINFLALLLYLYAIYIMIILLWFPLIAFGVCPVSQRPWHKLNSLKMMCVQY